MSKYIYHIVGLTHQINKGEDVIFAARDGIPQSLQFSEFTELLNTETDTLRQRVQELEAENARLKADKQELIEIAENDLQKVRVLQDKQHKATQDLAKENIAIQLGNATARIYGSSSLTNHASETEQD